VRLVRNVRLSLRALSAQRLRSALAVAGTAVGIGGVVVLSAIGEGARGAVLDRIQRLGASLLVITANTAEPRAGRTRQGDGRTNTLRAADAAALARGALSIARAAPARDRTMSVKAGAISTQTTILGTTPAWRDIRDFPVVTGRFFTDAENADAALVAVLGADARTNLFADSVDPLGRIIRIGQVPFRVVGVLAPKGVSVTGATSEDDRIVVPLESALRRLFEEVAITMIFAEATSRGALEHAQQEATAILRARHDVPDGNRDDFAIRGQWTLLETELAAQASFQRLITALGLLALLVGGVGILSIMLLAVRERRGEVGLRIAVGARRRDVLAQFLTESLLLSACGCVAGIAIGIGLADVVAVTTAWTPRISALTLTLAITAAAVVGIGFGVVPAWRAARLDPIDALRAD
jgi:putative ABC transport system permease protein